MARSRGFVLTDLQDGARDQEVTGKRKSRSAASHLLAVLHWKVTSVVKIHVIVIGCGARGRKQPMRPKAGTPCRDLHALRDTVANIRATRDRLDG